MGFATLYPSNGLTQSLVRKCLARSGFQIALEFNRLTLIGKCYVRNQAPRVVLVSVG